MGMTLIYPLLNSSLNNYYELKYSIRSICSVYTVTRVILVGGKPDWYTGEHIPFKDYGPIRKEENIFHKVRATGVDGMFCNDDHYLLAQLELHHKGSMHANYLVKKKNSSYARTLKNTLSVLGEDVNDYDTHCPMFVTAEGLSKLQDNWPQWGFGFKTMYCYTNNLTGCYYPDAKYQVIPDVIDRPYFSIQDGCANINKLEVLFTKKSIFEK